MVTSPGAKSSPGFGGYRFRNLCLEEGSGFLQQLPLEALWEVGVVGGFRCLVSRWTRKYVLVLWPVRMWYLCVGSLYLDTPVFGDVSQGSAGYVTGIRLSRFCWYEELLSCFHTVYFVGLHFLSTSSHRVLFQRFRPLVRSCQLLFRKRRKLAVRGLFSPLTQSPNTKQEC